MLYKAFMIVQNMTRFDDFHLVSSRLLWWRSMAMRGWKVNGRRWTLRRGSRMPRCVSVRWTRRREVIR